MPKQVLHLQGFNRGIKGNVSQRDLPEGFVPYSENVDSKSEGLVRGVKKCQLAGSNGASFDARFMRSIDFDNFLLIGQRSGGGVYSYDPDTDTVATIDATAFDDFLTMEPYNRELYCGTGPNSAPKWVGLIDHGQFGGSAPSGYQVEDAEASFLADQYPFER